MLFINLFSSSNYNAFAFLTTHFSDEPNLIIPYPVYFQIELIYGFL